MKFNREGYSRQIDVTEIPESVNGIRVAQELTVEVRYRGEPSGRKALTLDNAVMPLIAAAPTMLAALLEARHTLIEMYEELYPIDESDNDVTATIDKVIAAIKQARGDTPDAGEG
jgi:hypothetical protein